MSFRRFNRDELLTFLGALDQLLEEPIALTIIGGAAATLRYGAVSATKDIDTWYNIPAPILKVAGAARALTKLPIPIERAAVADAPYNYEDRLVKAHLKFKHLRVSVPERHDLVLMKIVRADRHDMDVIAEMHAKSPLSLKTLTGRFEDEMDHVIKDERIMRMQFRFLIEQLFGSEAAKQVATKRRPPRGGKV